MKLIVEINNVLLLVDTTKSASFLEALGEIKTLESRGYGQERKFIVSPNQEINVILPNENAFEATPEPFALLQKRVEQSDARWLEYHQRCNKAEKALLDLQKEMSNRGIILKPTVTTEKQETPF